MKKPWLLAAMLMGAAPAQAGWMRAESRHFVVYEEGDAATVRDAAERLEKLDRLQHALLGAPEKPEALKVRVYLLADSGQVQNTLPWAAGSGVAGYYDASVRGPYAVNTRADDRFNRFPAQLVLFHELTHHFMFQYFNATYPIWYSEGFADFIGATSIDSGNALTVGAPVDNRYYSLRGDRAEQWISAGVLLSAHNYAEVGGRVDLLYAEGWLLTHYLLLSGERKGELTRYLTAINAGRPYAAAAKEAFGDLGRLDRELRSYARRNKLPVKVFTFAAIDPGEIAVTPVGDAQAALMVADIRMDAGIPAGKADDFAAAVRKVAARRPDDPIALRLRVEADRLADDRRDRAAAIDRWTAAAPRDPALAFQRALLAMDVLVADKVKEAAPWEAVRADLIAAQKLARHDPAILKAYYDSFKAQGIDPTPGAHNALFRALEIVPQDAEVRYELAADFEARGLTDDAIRVIRPAALETDDTVKPRQRKQDEEMRKRFRLAGTTLHETPRDMLTRLEKARTGTAAGK